MIVWGGHLNGEVGTGGRYCIGCANETYSYADGDGDAFGDPLRYVRTCGGSIPPGYVTNEADCDDTNAARNPGANESCNGIDDDCDSVADEGVAAPAARPDLLVSALGGAAQLAWSAETDVTGYDVVRGSVALLQSSGGDFASSVTGCVANNLAATFVSDGTATAPGDGIWYLVRAVNCGGVGTYDTDSPQQARGRDARIGAAVDACP
jgi:hypothetical protein